MTPRPPERVAYHNGEIKPESQVAVSFRDRGFKYGDAVFDATRTFGGRPFRLEAHVDRLYRSLKYLYQAVNADEAFITSTSLCLCAVRTINHVAIGGGTVPGPVTRRLTEAFKEEARYDFVAQYLRHLRS